MQKIISLLVLSVLLSTQADAQLGNILKKTTDKAQQKAQQRVDNKIDQQIDKALDKAEGKQKTSKDTKSGKAEAPAEESDGEESTPKKEEHSFNSFKKFDFIPGDSILYAEDFSQDELAEFPLNWNTNGTGEVMPLDGIDGRWLRVHKNFRYLSANQSEFGENYTVEFDIVMQLKNNGWMFPNIKFGLFSAGDKSKTDNRFLTHFGETNYIEADLHPGTGGNSYSRLYSSANGRTHFSSASMPATVMEQFYFKPLHISIQVQKERFRMWVNSDKIFDVPKAVPPGAALNQLIFEIGSTNYPEDKYGLYISNIKVATGRPDTRHKLIEEGRFSTTGILFDLNSAVIKPESYAVVKDIAGVLKQFPAVKVKVVGHTSSDGDDNANMELSKKRAAAVKELLTKEFGVEADRIETEGKGETQPVADNKTREGKAANRRVEFIKL